MRGSRVRAQWDEDGFRRRFRIFIRGHEIEAEVPAVPVEAFLDWLGTAYDPAPGMPPNAAQLPTEITAKASLTVSSSICRLLMPAMVE